MRRAAAVLALTLAVTLGVASPASAAPRSFYVYVFSRNFAAAGDVCVYAHGGHPTRERLTYVWPSGRQVSSALCTTTH